jgi:hypothetical protein
MNRLRWWLVSGAGIPWALRIGARVSSTHPTGQRACRRTANFIVARQSLPSPVAPSILKGPGGSVFVSPLAQFSMSPDSLIGSSGLSPTNQRNSRF